MIEITLKKGEHIEKALRRLKKKMSREGTFEQVRRRRFFEKPSVKARRKLKEARFTAMLRERRADDL
jgi:small subunit ribosomal protein S21